MFRAPAENLSPSCAEITIHAANLGAVAEDKKERTNTPNSLDIDAITAPLRSPANHRTLNQLY